MRATGEVTTQLQAAFEALWDREAAAAYRHALAILQEPAEADDAVQEAFLRVLRAWDRLIDPTQLGGYLRQAVRSAALDRLRRRKVAQDAAPALEARARLLRLRPDAGAGPDAETAARALAALPGEQREVVVLRVWGELPFARIAERTGQPLGTAHSRYRLGMERLRELLRGER